MKEFLTIREIEFESINVLGENSGSRTSSENGLQTLQKLGARTVPVVSRGEQWVSALSVSNVIEFLGLDESAEPVLSPEQLVNRLSHVLNSADRYTRQFSDDQLKLKLTGRDRSYAQIAHHVFNIPVAFLDAVEKEQTFTYESTVAPPPAGMDSAESIVHFGRSVSERLQRWWNGQTDKTLNARIQTYYGDQSIHELLERTTWHSTQHVRQLISLLETLGTSPDQPLTADDLADLPLPKKVWD